MIHFYPIALNFQKFSRDDQIFGAPQMRSSVSNSLNTYEEVAS